MVFVLGGTVGHFKTGVLLAQDFQHVVQVRISHFGAQTLDFDTFETGHFKFREHFEYGNVFQVLARFQGLGLDRRRASRVQLLLDNGFVEGSLDHVTYSFLARIGTKTTLDFAHRHFAWTETSDLGLLGSLLQTLVDRSLDTLCRHGDAQAALESSSIFNRNLHGYSSLHRH